MLKSLLLQKKIVWQFSSLGSLDEKWLTEFGASLSSGITEDKTPLGPGDPLIIWPTVEDVRCSLEVTRTKFLRDYIFSLYFMDFVLNREIFKQRVMLLAMQFRAH